MSNTPTANFAYNKPAIGDRGWGTTWNANLDSIDSDFAEEHRSVAGQRGKHGPKVTILQTSTNNALVIDHSGTGSQIVVDINKTGTNSGNVIDVLNSGTGTALQITQAGAAASVTIDQNGASTAINVTQNATNNKTLFLRKTGTGAGTVLDIDNTGTGTGINVAQVGDGDGVYIQQTGASRGLYIEKVHTGASRAVVIDNSGTGAGLNILQNANALALDIDKTNTGSANVIDIDQSGSGYDIEGNADLWRVDNRGHAIFSSTPSKLKNTLNGANTFSATTKWEQMAVSSAQGNTAVTEAYFGAVFDGRFVYFCAERSATFIAYDTTASFTSIDAWEQIAQSSAQGGAAVDIAYTGVTFDGRYVYFVAQNSDTFIRHDTALPFTSTSAWQQIAMSSAQGAAALDAAYLGATYDGRYIYYCAQQSNTFIRYDTTKVFNAIASWEQIAMSSAQGAAVTAGNNYQTDCFDGRYVYYVARDSDTFIRFDTTASFTAIASWSQIAMSSAQGAAALDTAYAGISFDGRYLYYCTLNSDTFIRYDSTRSFTGITSWQQIAMSSAQGGAAVDVGYQGVTFDGRYMYYAGSSSNTQIRFDTTLAFTAIASWQQVALSSSLGAASPGNVFQGLAFDGHHIYYVPRGTSTMIRFFANGTSVPSPTEYAQVSS